MSSMKFLFKQWSIRWAKEKGSNKLIRTEKSRREILLVSFDVLNNLSRLRLSFRGNGKRRYFLGNSISLLSKWHDKSVTYWTVFTNSWKNEFIHSLYWCSRYVTGRPEPLWMFLKTPGKPNTRYQLSVLASVARDEANHAKLAWYVQMQMFMVNNGKTKSFLVLSKLWNRNTKSYCYHFVLEHCNLTHVINSFGTFSSMTVAM